MLYEVPRQMNSNLRYERTLVAILFLSWGTVFLDRMSQFYLAPYFIPEFRLTHQQVGTLASALAIAWALSTLFFGALSDRFGRLRILIPAMFAFSLLSWLSAMVHSYHQLLIVRALMGIAEGPTWSVITALIEESSPASRRGRNVGLVVSAAALVGLAAAPVLTTQVAARWGWRASFFVAGVPGILMASLMWRYVREPEAKTGEASSHAPARFADYLSLLRYRNLWLCCVGSGSFMTWLFLQNVFAPLYITQVAHQAPTTAGFLLGATGLGSFFLGFLLPTLSDRIGRKPAVLVMAVMSVCVPLALLCSFLYSVPWLLAAILFLTNTGQAIAALVLVLVPSESVPPRFAATSIGLVTLAGELTGATLAPALGGSLAEKYGLAIPLWMAAGGSALLFLVGLFLKPAPHAKSVQSLAA